MKEEDLVNSQVDSILNGSYSDPDPQKEVETRVSDILGSYHLSTPAAISTLESKIKPIDSLTNTSYSSINPSKQVIGAINQRLKKESSVQSDDRYAQNVVRNAQFLPENIRTPALQTIPLIKSSLEAEGITDPNSLAYALATVNHESGFVPKDEIQAGQNDPQWLKNAQSSYDGGWPYHGRGFIQLTGKGNYEAMGKRIGVDLVNNPDLANDPSVAAKILAAFMKDRGVIDYTKKGDFVNARTPINGDQWNYQKVANEAQQWLGVIQPPNPFMK